MRQRNWCWTFLIILILSAAPAWTPIAMAQNIPQPTNLDPATKQKVQGAMRGLNMPFIANYGQVDKSVRYYARTFGGTVFVTQEGDIVYSLPNGSAEKGPRTPRLPAAQKIMPEQRKKDNGVALCESFIGALPANPTGIGENQGNVNYFTGGDPAKWRKNIASYQRIGLGEIYRNIELALEVHGNNVEKLFYVRPGADPKKIQVRMQGANELRINEAGELEALTALGVVRFTAPVAYQDVLFNGKTKRQYVEVAYQVTDDRYGFIIGDYDSSRELVIDPLLASTFLGGEGGGGYEGVDEAYSIAIDATGSVFVTGFTDATDFPTTSDSYNNSHTGFYIYCDVFVVKLSSDLNTLSAATFLGGYNEDYGYALTLDNDGNVYVTGSTYSSDFPTTGAYDDDYSGSGDVFIAKLTSDLSTLSASTFLGGSDTDDCLSLVLDSNDDVYVTGYTSSSDFPAISGAYDTSKSDSYDVFVAKLTSNLNALSAATFLGGSSSDYGYALAQDSGDGVYVTGSTYSSDFPTTGAYDDDYSGSGDVFIAKLTSDLSTLSAATFLGGSDTDSCRSLVLNSNDDVYVTGSTSSSDFPTTSGAYNASKSNSYDVFVAKLSSDLSALSASTFLGDSSSDYGRALALNSSGDVYVMGYTSSSDFPTISGAYDESKSGSYDVFVAKLSSDLSALSVSTFLGGSNFDYGHALAVDNAGDVYVTGYTGHSSDFPITGGAYNESYNGGTSDVFITKLSPDLSALSASTFLGGSANYDYGRSLAVNNTGDVYITGYTGSLDFPTTSGAYDETHNGDYSDVFIAKLNSDLNTLTASTFLSGSSDYDYSHALALDNSGNVYVTGYTGSSDFPTTSGAYDATHSGSFDVFIVKLTPDLSELSAATFLGGSAGYDYGQALALDSEGSVYVTGYTWAIIGSSDFPTTSGAYNETCNGSGDVFITKLNSDLSTLSASTFLGGSNFDYGLALVLDNDGVYITGYTGSSDFPTTSGAYDQGYHGDYDVFVAKLNSDLSALSASTFLGGSNDDHAHALVLDSDGIYITGYTDSSDFPTISGAYDETHNEYDDVFITKLNSDLSALAASTFLGGSSKDHAYALNLDEEGNVYVTGSTWSSSFPSTSGAYDETHNGYDDVFITKLNSDLSGLSASTFLGGSSGYEYGYALALDGNSVYVAGHTESYEFPTISGAYDENYNSGYDVFIVKLDLTPSFLLATATTGDGTGTINSSPTGISCPDDCEESYAQDTQVTLQATSDDQSEFSGWSGDCSGTSDCVLTMDANHDVTATFTLINNQNCGITIDKNGDGGGAVTSTNGDISCDTSCLTTSHDSSCGETVTLQATADNDSIFSGWSGDCSGTSDCVLTMDAYYDVTATFTLINNQSCGLTINKNGAGGGVVTSTDGNISCDTSCLTTSHDYSCGETVTLQATADNDSIFTGWSGGDCSGTGDCMVSVDQAVTIFATFAPAQADYQLTLYKTGTGKGAVFSTDNHISCHDSCPSASYLYNQGDKVTLQATAAEGSTFNGWSGACSGTEDCVIIMNQEQSVTAEFTGTSVSVENFPWMMFVPIIINNAE